jgi:myosin-crossreactive antigen
MSARHPENSYSSVSVLSSSCKTDHVADLHIKTQVRDIDVNKINNIKAKARRSKTNARVKAIDLTLKAKAEDKHH